VPFEVAARLALIRTRLAKATPRPWDFHRQHPYDAEGFAIENEASIRPASGSVAASPLLTYWDASFAVAARDDIPFLLDLIPDDPGTLKGIRWGESVGASGTGDAMVVEIPVVLPGATDWSMMTMPVKDAVTLWHMLGSTIRHETL
jgi:hypothetical protein